jgi:hypothetical protein
MRIAGRLIATSLLFGSGLLLATRAAPADGGPPGIVGTWRGTSTCTDRVAAPACNDEKVVYEITAVAGASDRVSVQADKIVGGERGTMGVMEFRLQKDGSWASEFQSPRARSGWRLVVDGNRMTGTATLLPSNAVIRRMELTREK